MPKIKSGLGAGLSSLIPKRKNLSRRMTGIEKEENSVEIKNTSQDFKEPVLEIDVSKISPNPHQPRVRFEQVALQELADSIKEQGVLQPILVTPAYAEASAGKQYELVAGERRLRAAKLAGLKKIPAIVKSYSEERKVEVALIENVQRENLNIIEEAKVYLNLRDEFDLTLQEISDNVGKSPEYVSVAMKMLELPAEVQKLIADRTISRNHGILILKLGDVEKMILLAKKIIDEKLTIPETEAIISRKFPKSSTRSNSGRPRNIDKELLEIENQLTGTLDTKVKLSGAVDKGSITLMFFSKDELGKLLKRLED
ncbi:ParB/RepB/Spo0J family partition protein [bacterium]|nr:MAG: ParB/RepB/Spo0J family partition protein [bacterium]